MKKRLHSTLRTALLTLVVSAWGIFFVGASLYALDVQQITPNASFGIGGYYGMYNISSTRDNDGPGPAKNGYGFGGGFICESMITSAFGVGSGVWFNQTNFKYENMNASGSFQSLTMPVLALASLSYNRFRFDILGGFVISYIMNAKYKVNGETFEILKYANCYQIGASGGFRIRFAVSRFTDIFIALQGEKYFTSLYDTGESSSQMFGASVLSGVLFRTF